MSKDKKEGRLKMSLKLSKSVNYIIKRLFCKELFSIAKELSKL